MSAVEGQGLVVSGGMAGRLRALGRSLSGDSAEARTKRSALFSIAARVFNAGILLLTHVMLARLLGAEGFGVFSLATTWVLTLLGLATLGLTMTPQRFAPGYMARGETRLLAGLYRFSHAAPLAAGAVIAALGWAVVMHAPLSLTPEARLALALAFLALA